MDRVAQLKEVQDEARALFQKKNADYGDSFATYGPVGVLVRMGDKISRLNSITQKGVHLINTESLRDTLVDLHNYSAMAVLLLDEGRDITVNTSSNKTTRVEELKNEKQEKQENQIEFMKKIHTVRGFTDIEPY
tara:strand:+ start:911 stop:1312 length:402 start_codon:yes stop_codon:yes gene_type:complete